MRLRWHPCIDHQGSAAESFLRDYFESNERNALLICAGGFDQRARKIPVMLAGIMGLRLEVVALREERPSPAAHLVEAAESNIKAIKAVCGDSFDMHSIDVFDTDNAVVVGRRAIAAIKDLNFTKYTDLIVDLSALSIGASFPVVRFLDRMVVKEGGNLHILLLPAGPGGEPGDRELTDGVSVPLSFDGKLGQDEAFGAHKLWVPHLGPGRRTALDRVHEDLSPDEIVPVLPFPCLPPRVGDSLLAEYTDEIESVWEVDPRSILYADDRHPLDLYRSICRLCEGREKIFGTLKQSFVILTPLGSKALTVGALMAAIELDLPVRYVETLSYDLAPREGSESLGEVIHVWLAGDVYPRNVGD